MVLKGKQAFNITGLENYKISTLHIYWYWYKSGFSELIFFINECRSSLVSFTSRIIRVFIRTRTNIFDTLIYVSMNFAWNSRLKDKHFFQKTLSIVRNWIKNDITAHPICRSSKDFGKFVWVLKIITSFTHSPTTAPRCKSKTITRFPVQIFSVCQEEVFPGGRDTPRFNEVSQDQQCYEVQLPLRISLSDKPRFTLDSKGWVSEWVRKF